MRIGLVTEEYPPANGPLADQVHQFAREARRLGHVVKVLTGSPPRPARRTPGRLPRLHALGQSGQLRSEPAPPAWERDVIRIGQGIPLLRRGAISRLAGGLGLGTAVRAVLARERLDVVHLHGPLSPVLPLLALHHASGPVVGTFHAPLEPGLLWRLAQGPLQRYLDRLDAAVVTSRASLASLPERIRGDLRVIPPGVDVECLPRGCRIRGLQDGRLNVLHAAGLEPRARLATVLAAAQRLRRTVEVRVLVLGDGPLLARARVLVPAELEGQVVFAQAAEARPDWYATADVCCAPAAAPSAVLEAMAAGRAVLAADVEANRELLRHGREGELLPVEDAGAWARALARLAREPARAAAYGERGRASAQRYGWAGVTREILNLYRAIGVRG